MKNLSEFEFRTQPWFEQSQVPAFVQSKIPMKTLVIFCFDPRAEDVPARVAKTLGDEVFPGENILDEFGNKVGSTRTLFPISNAGGRAVGALQSIATMEYLFGVENVVVVHHSFCGATAFTPEVLIESHREKHHGDISHLFNHESLSIPDFRQSLAYDIELLRTNPAVPKGINLIGFFYDINSGELTELVRRKSGETKIYCQV